MASEVVTAAALVLGLGVLAQIVSRRSRVPSIILLLAAGLTVGPVLGWLDPDALLGDLLPPLISLGVALILFEGGMGLDWREVRAHGTAVTRLVTLGIGITWVVGLGAATLVLGWGLRDAALLAAILVVTGPTVVLPLLHHIRPRRDVDAVARWEGILVDPIGAVFAVVVFEATSRGAEGLLGFGTALLSGVGLGVAGALLLVFAERRFLIPHALAPAFALALVVVTYAAAEVVFAESGLVAVTAMGIALANQRRTRVYHALNWREPLSVLLLGTLFILLAARIDAAQLIAIAADPRSWVFVGILVLVARPLAVAVCTATTRLSVRDRVFLSALAPRGIVAAAVAALFALRMAVRGDPIPDLVPLVFFVVITTVVLYGVLARPLANLLGISRPPPNGVLLVGANTITRTLAAGLEQDKVRVTILDADPQALTAARMEGREVMHARIHAGDVADAVDLADIGALWAVTPHASTNALACVRFEEEFGRASIYQVPVGDAAPAPGDRMLWGVSYRTLRDRIQKGWELRRTPITELFTADDHCRHHPDAIWMWLCTPEGRLLPFTQDHRPDPQNGSFLTALVPPEPKDQDARRERAAHGPSKA